MLVPLHVEDDEQIAADVHFDSPRPTHSLTLGGDDPPFRDSTFFNQIIYRGVKTLARKFARAFAAPKTGYDDERFIFARGYGGVVQ
jgi:hypothetical protein